MGPTHPEFATFAERETWQQSLLSPDFPAIREYMKTRNHHVIEVESLKGKWVAVWSFHGTHSRSRASRVADNLNAIAQVDWARVRKAKK